MKMTIRDRIANWLADGVHEKAVRSNAERAERSARAIAELSKEVMNLRLDLIECKGALSDIAAMETPNCANIGKRMAKRAREAMQ